MKLSAARIVQLRLRLKLYFLVCQSVWANCCQQLMTWHCSLLDFTLNLAGIVAYCFINYLLENFICPRLSTPRELAWPGLAFVLCC